MKCRRQQILAISGGGARGLYPARIVANAEERTGVSFATHFDLMAGTSAGGILVLALAAEIPAKRLVEILKEHSAEIFPPIRSKIFETRSGFFRKLSQGVFAAKYNSKGLKVVLEELFEDKKIKDLKHRVVIPTVNYSTGDPQFFKTQHHSRFDRDGKQRLVDVAMATSAAPYYFPHHAIGSSHYVDGGLVGNAPDLFALHELEYNTENFEFSPDTVHLMSLGTCGKGHSAGTFWSNDKGLLQWNKNIIDLTISSQEKVTKFILSQRLGERYFRLDGDTAGLEAISLPLDGASSMQLNKLMSFADMTSQRFGNQAGFQTFLNYKAKPPTFYNQETHHE